MAGAQLDAAAQQAAAGQWPYTHSLGYLLEGELRARHEKTVRLNLQFARLPYPKRLEEFDFSQQPSLDRRLIDEPATLRFLPEGRSLVLLSGQRLWKRFCRMVQIPERDRRAVLRLISSLSQARKSA